MVVSTMNQTDAVLTLDLSVPFLSPDAQAHLLARLEPLLDMTTHPGPQGVPWPDRLRYALVRLRYGCSYRALACVLNISTTTLHRNIKPVYDAVLQLEPLLPDGTVADSFDTVLAWCQENGLRILLDGTDLRIGKPGADQELYYTGKHKTHTVKTLVLCDRAGRVVWVTPLVAGAQHDWHVAAASGVVDALENYDIEVLGDTAYIKLKELCPYAEIPAKKKPGHERNPVDVFFNTIIAKQRVVVEHGIRRLKCWQILTRHKPRKQELPDLLYMCWCLTSYQQAWPPS